jgi:hypothetical protein
VTAKASDAAPSAASGSECEQAYGELVVLIDSFKGIPGNTATPAPPAREDFVKACESLPKEVRPCLRVSHAMPHAKECQALIDALPEDVKARAKALLAQGQK